MHFFYFFLSFIVPGTSFLDNGLGESSISLGMSFFFYYFFSACTCKGVGFSLEYEKGKVAIDQLIVQEWNEVFLGPPYREVGTHSQRDGPELG